MHGHDEITIRQNAYKIAWKISVYYANANKEYFEIHCTW